MEFIEIASLATTLQQNIGRVIIGKEAQTELLLTALFAGGHVLLEDIPGTGKTTLAKSLARSLDCCFSRIQFTPDLLPSDVTGMRIYEQHTGQFRFLKGPAFTNVLLADEINRATPRTQSALLECMEEGQITEGGITYPLEKPFLVIATQNPVETQGTFPLPEAQMDRFLMRLSLGYPSREESVALMQRFLVDRPLESLCPVAGKDALIRAQELVRQVSIQEDVLSYMASLCEAARDPEKVRLGPSPRSLLALMRCCQALAAIRGRDFVTPDDVKQLAVPVMAHRILLRGIHYNESSESFLKGILGSLPAPTEQRL